ncbi:hypothetical protein H0H92_014439 [Tricholoma furcatifolium]|nr:hypothetical protein H0H92_014439 [Tricholoma furcatifolium]
MPNQRCTNCSQASRPCTYDEPSKPRGPPKAYITGLEDEVEKLEALLKQLHPNGDYSKQLGPPVVRDSWKDDADTQQPLWSNSLPVEVRVSIPLTSVLDDTDQDSSEEILDVLELPIHGERMQKLQLRGDEEPLPKESTEHTYARFHGKSSPVGLVGVTQMFKMMHLLDHGTKHDARLDGSDYAGSIPRSKSPAFQPTHYRPKFWKMPERERQWEQRDMNVQSLIMQLLSAFPPADLIPELMRVYFLHSNCPLPLLHRPTFERQWKENLHHTNVWFTAVCLGVFAIASRWSSDSRVVPDGATTPSGSPDWSLAGWKYCKAGIGLLEVRRRLFCPTTLFELQSFSLFSTYLRDSAHRPLTWVLVGCAIRKAQDVGVHRKKVHGREPTAESELWKRVFWCLVILDRFESAVTGRPALVGEEDFDVDLPLEVDDEYWEANDSGVTFQQPKDVPANKIISFNQIIKLSRNLAFALKTLYAADKERILSGLSPSSWRRAILKHISAGLEGWYKGVPEHLSWLHQTENSPHKVDAAVLHTTYRLIEMLIYQMFIPNFITSSSALSEFNDHGRLSPSDVAPLDLCVDAAHDCANISDRQNLIALSTWPIYIYASQVASTILLIKIWSVKMQEKALHARGVEDVKPPMVTLEPLYKSLKILSNILDMAECRWGFVSPYLQEFRRALPDNLPDEIPLPDVANKNDVDCPASHLELEDPSYPNLVQPSPQQPFSTNSLSQSASSHQPPRRSQNRLSYSSESSYSLQSASQPAQSLPFNEASSAQHVRAEGRHSQDLPSIDYLTPTEYRLRQHSTDGPLTTKLNDDVIAPYNSNRRRLDEDLALPSLYDRSKLSSLNDSSPTLPSFNPRTLHPIRSLPYLRHPVPFTSHDNNAHRTREGLKTDAGRHGDSAGTTGSLTQNIDITILGHSYPLKPNGLSTKQDRRHASQPERVIAPHDWPANSNKPCTRPVLDTDILSHKN